MDPDDGVLRINLAHYNTPDEIARLITAAWINCSESGGSMPHLFNRVPRVVDQVLN